MKWETNKIFTTIIAKDLRRKDTEGQRYCAKNYQVFQNKNKT